LAASVDYQMEPNIPVSYTLSAKVSASQGEGRIASPAGVAVWSFYRHGAAKLEFVSNSATLEVPP
jgi:hypothetical protein